MSRTPTLTKKDIRNAGLRWMVMPVTVFNYETQLAPAVVYAFAPALRKIYPDGDDYIKALNNHYKYYNSQPYMSSIILGAALAIEDNEGIDGLEAVQNFKTGIMGPLAGIGDTIFWVLIPTIWGSIAAYMALEGNPTGAIMWVIFNLVMLVFRLRFFEWGYSAGRRIINEFGTQLSVFTDAASVLGLCVVGALIPSVITVTVPFVFKVGGEKTMAIQGLLDGIMPGLVPVLLTLGIFKLIGKKKVKMTNVILIVLVVSTIGAYFKILG